MDLENINQDLSIKLYNDLNISCNKIDELLIEYKNFNEINNTNNSDKQKESEIVLSSKKSENDKNSRHKKPITIKSTHISDQINKKSLNAELNFLENYQTLPSITKYENFRENLEMQTNNNNL